MLEFPKTKTADHLELELRLGKLRCLPPGLQILKEHIAPIGILLSYGNSIIPTLSFRRWRKIETRHRR